MDVRDQGIETVGSVLQPHGEILPLRCDEARLAVFSAPLVAGVLDEERSVIDRFSDGGIMGIRRHVFHAEALGSHKAFKLAEMPRGSLFLSGDLVEAIRATGMTAGTDFTLVYEEGHARASWSMRETHDSRPRVSETEWTLV